MTDRRSRRLSPSRLRRRLPAGGALLAVVAVVVWFAFATPPLEPYATFVRPDGAYRVVVLRQPLRWAVFPGQAGDAPGVARLYDRQGRLLEETAIDMVQLVDRVEWSDNAVRIPLVAEWTVRADPE